MRAPPWMENDPHILTRMTEYLGGPPLEEATAVYISRCDRPTYFDFALKLPTELPTFLAEGADVARSLWDHAALLVHLEVDFINFDCPVAPFTDPVRTFSLQQPLIAVLERLFDLFGIAPLHLVTGRGHHFVWKVPRRSSCLEKLGKVGRLPMSLRELYHCSQSPTGETVAADLAKGFAGIGLVLEYLANRLAREAAEATAVPIRLTEVEAVPVGGKRETISIDISSFGDPLHTRTIRIPFSIYRKPWEKGLASDPQVAERLPRMFAIPVSRAGIIFEAIDLMRDARRVAEFAKETSALIPSQPEGTERLLAAYLASHEKKFHDWFYVRKHHPQGKWPQTYDRLQLDLLPPCIRRILLHPNDLLLKPAGMQQVTRALMALGWHPRHVAGLIRSKFERDFDWGDQWRRYDPATRADFYTRIFAGRLVLGDDLDDFTCQGTKSRGFCFQPEAHCDLEPFRSSLVERKKHERLGHRPFNRLILPARPF
jgi:hypothetical protein